jgi:hypothetical protein
MTSEFGRLKSLSNRSDDKDWDLHSQVMLALVSSVILWTVAILLVRYLVRATT